MGMDTTIGRSLVFLGPFGGLPRRAEPELEQARAGKATFCGSARAPHKRAPPALLRDRVVPFGLELLAEPSQTGPYM